MFGGIGQTGPLGYSMLPSVMGNTAGAQSLMGGMMSQGMATGAPMLGGMSGMMGMDPISLGMKAASLAWSRGGAGVLGAGMAGMGTMAGAGVLGAGAAWAGGQMLSGAQQQMGLNRGLAQNFNFMNAQGGQGFSSNQGFRIGEDVRAMTHEFGKGGETANFSELSRLATNMGRMGMGQNVRTVKEFKDKFKQMVDSVKTIATELGTSLEEAQKMMASMKQTGIFKPGQAMTAAHLMRSTALGGGLAMSEVSSMMNIGSQISRSVGGLGRAGAMGGMKTIGQIGTAMQMGVLNEEDVYNATGLSGAEGRQAFATEMMSKSAKFLKSGKGRRFLASVAGANGELDQESMMEWMTGGVGTGRTMQMAGKNLAGVGRADFIRNEGHLRGAALEKFGGMLQPMVYKQWLQQKGWDANNMNDMSMLAFQRFSGLGRDEADAAVKVVNQLPEIMRSQSVTDSRMERSDLLARRGKTVGIEGMKRKLDQSREMVQGKLQQWGADLLEEGSDQIASFFNKMTGAYEQQANEAVSSFVSRTRSGGAVGKSAQRQFKRLFEGSMGAIGRDSRGGQVSGGMTSGQKYEQDLSNQIGAISRAKVTAEDREYNGSLSGMMYERWLTNEGMGMVGEDRLAGTQAFLKNRAATGDRSDIMKYEQWKQSSSTERAAMTARMESANGLGEEMGIGAGLMEQREKAALNALGGSGETTVAGRNAAIGAKLLGKQSTWYGSALGVAAKSLTAVPLAFMAAGEGIGNLFTGGSAFESKTTDALSGGIGSAVENFFDGGDRKQRMQAGMLIQDEGVRANIAAVASGKGDISLAQDRLRSLRYRQTKGELGEGTTDATELKLMNRAAGVNIMNRKLRALGLSDISQLTDPKQRESLENSIRLATKDDSITLDSVAKFRDTAQGAMDDVSRAAIQQAATDISSSQSFERDRYEKMGVAQYKQVREETRYTAKNGAGQMLLDQMNSEADAWGLKDPAAREKFFKEYSVGGKGPLAGGMSQGQWDLLGIDRADVPIYGSEMELTAASKKKMDASMKATGQTGAVAAGQEAARLAMAVTNVDFSKGDAHENLKKYFDATASRDKHFGTMSIEQKRAWARTHAGTEMGESMAVSLSQHERLIGLQNGQARRGITGEAAKYSAASDFLGVGMSKDEAMALTGKGSEAATAQVLSKLGVKGGVLESTAGKAFTADVNEAMRLAKEGKTGEAASLLGSARQNAPEEIAKALADAENKKAAGQGDPTAKIVAAINELPGAIAGLINLASGGDTAGPGYQGPPAPGQPAPGR